MRGILDDKKGKLEKFLSVFLMVLIPLILIISLGINAQENSSTITPLPIAETPSASEEQTQELPEIIDFCENVVCEDSSLTCQNGFVATCPNTCNTESGECSLCVPDCTGQDIISNTEDLCNAICGSIQCPEGFLCENSCDIDSGVCTTNQIPIESPESQEMNESENLVELPELIISNETDKAKETIGNDTSENMGENETIVEDPVLEDETSFESGGGATGNIIDESPPLTPPKIGAEFVYEKKTTRNGEFTVNAKITNIGDVNVNEAFIDLNNVNGFEIASRTACRNIRVGESCTAEIVLMANQEASLGKNKIKFSVRYK